jgi:hypothetical protein
VKKPRIEKTKAQKKEKVLKNILLKKEEKGFDAKKCCFVVETIGVFVSYLGILQCQMIAYCSAKCIG